MIQIALRKTQNQQLQERNMNTRSYLLYAGLVGVFFGVGYLLFPVLTGGMVWKFAGGTDVMLARMCGVFLIVWGGIAVLMRDTQDSISIRAVMSITVLGHILTAGLFLIAMNTGAATSMAWGNVLLSIVLGAGAAYCMPKARTVTA
jgi:hypothetical protein